MKTTLALAAASAALIATLAVAAPASAQQTEVRVRHAVARMVVIVEDRADIAVEIEPGTSGLPTPTVTRVGDEVRIDGELGRNAVRNCRSGPGGAPQPGQGATVEVRDRGRIDLTTAPLIVVRTPTTVDVSVEDGAAVFGAVGRGARSVSLGNTGCGDWTVANVDGPTELSVAGSGSIRTGTSSSVSASIVGSGDVVVGATDSLEASIAGSGDVIAAAVRGAVEVNIAGSGNLVVRTGDVGAVEANILGSGDVEIAGRAASVEANVMGAGDIRVAGVNGAVSTHAMGSGRVRIGN